MFFERDRIENMRAMILADTPEAPPKGPGRHSPMQRRDFEGIFRPWTACR
jgi:pyruvate,orthophosphate dikinase